MLGDKMGVLMNRVGGLGDRVGIGWRWGLMGRGRGLMGWDLMGRAGGGFNG